MPRIFLPSSYSLSPLHQGFNCLNKKTKWDAHSCEVRIWKNKERAGQKTDRSQANLTSNKMTDSRKQQEILQHNKVIHEYKKATCKAKVLKVAPKTNESVCIYKIFFAFELFC